MRIKAIDELIVQCNTYLDDKNGRGELLESYLTQFLLVKIYQIFEERIREIVYARADKVGDTEVANFVKFSNKKFRGLFTSDLQKTLLKKFSESYANEFQERLSADNIGQKYNSLISNRHAISHTGNPIYATFDDTVSAYEEGHKVLDVLKDIFGLE